MVAEPTSSSSSSQIYLKPIRNPPSNQNKEPRVTEEHEARAPMGNCFSRTYEISIASQPVKPPPVSPPAASPPSSDRSNPKAALFYVNKAPSFGDVRVRNDKNIILLYY